MYELSKKQRIKRIITFLIITTLLSSFFYFLVISFGVGNSDFIHYAFGLMCILGIAALLTINIYKGDISELGWKWGKTRLQLLIYCIPFLYSFGTYLVIWITGLGGFYNIQFVNSVVESFGWSSLSPHLC